MIMEQNGPNGWVAQMFTFLVLRRAHMEELRGFSVHSTSVIIMPTVLPDAVSSWLIMVVTSLLVLPKHVYYLHVFAHFSYSEDSSSGKKLIHPELWGHLPWELCPHIPHQCSRIPRAGMPFSLHPHHCTVLGYVSSLLLGISWNQNHVYLTENWIKYEISSWISLVLNFGHMALAGVAHFIWASPCRLKGQGFGPQSGHMQKGWLMFFFLSFSPHLAFSLEACPWMRIK